MHRRFILFILLGCSLGHSIAQQRSRVATNTVSPPDTGPDKFYYANRNEPPRAIEFNARTVTASTFLANVNHYFNIPDEFTFTEAETTTDNLGMRHHLLQQYYKGIPVEGMGYRVHEKNGFITSANGKAVRTINLDTHVRLSEEQAFQLGVNYLHTKDTIFSDGKLLIVSKDFTFAPESFSIAFQFDMDVSLIERWRISIDAGSGQLINKVSLVNSCFKDKEITQPLPYGTGTGLTNYYGNQTIRVEKYTNGSSRLFGQTEHGGTIGTYDFHHASVLALLFGMNVPVYDFYSSDNTYTNTYTKPAVSAQWAAEQAYEYYFKKHSRNSYDNAGGTVTSYVHVDQGLDNAFWTGKVLAFGDGSNNNPLVELDIVSHELTHGVTQNEAQLQYYNESGALNESFSDILGKAVEFYTFGDSATWQLGRHYRTGGLRDFSNPNRKNQPDTWQGDLWYTGADDNGGVHYNSGVQNYWFYLLCNGGSGVNDHQLNYSVKSIGMDTAANITYRNLTEYLSYNSDYLDSRIGSLLATADLYGKNSTAYLQVANAWDAVGVTAQPIITSLDVYDITATTVKIKGSLFPRGDTVTYHFEYGTTPAFGRTSSTYKYTGTVEGVLTGLQAETKYYLRLVATNENGNAYTSTVFTTISLAPLVKIKRTVDVTETTATLYGQVNPNSLPATFYFEYGLTTAFGLVTPSISMPDTTAYLDVSAIITDLQPRQTYYYRLVATNGFSTSKTESVNFFTAMKPVISSFTPVSAPIDTEVTLTGQNFNPAPEKNLVNFGATRATVLAATSTVLKVKVPAGASLRPITLLDTESGLAAESVQEFVPTYSGVFQKNSLQLRVGINDIWVSQTLVHDMDGDTKPDIIARHYPGFSVFQNVNQGGDITDKSFIRNSYTVQPNGNFSLADFDGNGLKDIVMPYQNGLRIYPNLSVPGFIFFGVPVDLSTVYFRDVTFKDFDQDGRIDIATLSYLPGDSSLVIIFRNINPKGFLTANNFEKKYQYILPYYGTFLGSDDLNNDSKPDLTVGISYKTFLPILKNNSHPGVFDFEESSVEGLLQRESTKYLSQDLNQDGWREIISKRLYQTPGDVSIFENKRSSTNISMENPIVALSGYTASVIQAGDLNGDGKVDLIVGTDDGRSILLKNKMMVNEHLSDYSFEKFIEYGVINSSVNNQFSTTINDLNGDGRPDILTTYAFNQLSHQGYAMEIRQNSPNECPDPSLLRLDISRSTATIVLPPNTTLDQFEIEFKTSDYNYWNSVYSTTIFLSAGYTYQLRTRAKCYLGFTDYSYIDFTVACVDLSSFSITSVGIDKVSYSATNLSSFEIQYSVAGINNWTSIYQYSNQLLNLLPGTTYDLRFRGRCNPLAEFQYKQVTTLCPALSKLTLTNIRYNTAMVSATSNYTGKAILEYSADNTTWTLIDQTGTMAPLVPGKQYFVRGSLGCTNISSDFIYTSFTTPCPTVSMLSADAVTPFSANINWIDESDTERYTITYSMTAGGPVTTVETNATSFQLSGLTPGTQYTVAVAPYCIMTKDFTATRFSTVCFVPFNLAAQSITHTTADLSWSDNFSGVPYSIDYSIAGSNVWITKETPSTAMSLIELRPGTQYEARVHINCISEKAPYVSVLFDTNLYEETMFAPNPTDSEITIYPSKSLIGNSFGIYDNTGRRLRQGTLTDYTIDLSSLSAGIYILKIDGEKPMKIIKH